MPNNYNEIHFVTRKFLRSLQSQLDDLRIAVVEAMEMVKKLPYRKEYVTNYPSLARDCLVVALYKKFCKTGLGGLYVMSGFPQSLRFTGQGITLAVRREGGFRNTFKDIPCQEKPTSGKIILVLLWEYPQEGQDVLSTFKLQAFEDTNDLETAQLLSQPFNIVINPEELPIGLFDPQDHAQMSLDFG